MREQELPPRAEFSTAPPKLTAAEVLRDILRHSEVSCVVPGTSSVEEAEDNARAGHAPIVLSANGDQENAGPNHRRDQGHDLQPVRRLRLPLQQAPTGLVAVQGCVHHSLPVRDIRNGG